VESAGRQPAVVLVFSDASPRITPSLRVELRPLCMTDVRQMVSVGDERGLIPLAAIGATSGVSIGSPLPLWFVPLESRRPAWSIPAPIGEE
jgi:hypothetical protein